MRPFLHAGNPALTLGDAMQVYEWLFAAYNGIATGMAIFLVAAGLTWIFGILKILNMAHGHFFMTGRRTCRRITPQLLGLGAAGYL